MSFFSAKNLTAGYSGKSVIENVSFELEAGQILGIIGANGSGKTTLLKSICNVLPHQGECFLENKHLEKLSTKDMAALCSYIPQQSGISIDISVLDVVFMGFNPRLKLLERPNQEMIEKAKTMLEKVSLGGRENTNYLHLSEGQKQLCIMARALAAESSLLLLDEPESALDFRFRYWIMELIREWAGFGRGAVMTLHDSNLALNYCDKLLLLSGGKMVGVIFPKTDSIEYLEEKLESIYGRVSLQRCRLKNGQEQLIMLKEPEDI